MSGITDDLNFVFKKTLNVVDATTGLNTTEYFYEDTRTGKEVKSSSAKAGALGNVPVSPIDTFGTGKTTLGVGNTTETASEGSLYPQNGVDSRAYAVKTTVSGEKGDTYEDQGETITLGRAPRSLFNAWTLHRYANRTGIANYSKSDTKGDDYNKPVFGGVAGNQANMNPTANNIIEYSRGVGGECFSYSYGDFIQMEHYGQISNDYLVTLRRFAYPVPDDLLSPIQGGTGGKQIDTSQPDLARAVTWLSPSLGNDLKEILKFKTGFKWKTAESDIQDAASTTSDRGALGAAIDSTGQGAAIESGLNGFTSVQAAKLKKVGNVDHTKATYPNKVFGPLNIIDNVLARDKGLVFEQEFKLSFHYDLKSYPGTSPKVAFMDTLANVLALTFNNAPFWGGATRFSGSGNTGKPFGDTSKLASGDYAGYIGSIADTLAGMGGNFMDQLKKTASNVKNGAGINKILGDSSILENIVGGGLMSLLGGPSGGDVIKAFLTGDPTGQWHVTIGNPMNPIVVCGNLCLQDSEVSFEGPLGFEGFPSKMKVDISLKPGRPRDKTEIESMFNAGRGRIYLQPEWGDGENMDVDAMHNTDAYGGKSAGNNIGNAPYMSRLSDMAAG
jgi:hypothetical protein